MTIDIEKLAKESGCERYDLGKREAYLNQGRFTFDANQLKQFAEAYCQEKQRQQEPVAKINAQWSCPDSLGKKHRERYVQFKNGIIPQEGIELFTYPPDAAKVHDKRVEELGAKNRELSASINDLREALECILENDGADGIIEMDTKTKEYLINYAILDILQKKLDNVDKLHKEGYKNEED